MAWIRPDAGWRFGPDHRGAADPERDTLVWTTDDRPAGAGYEIVLNLSNSRPTAERRVLTPDPCCLTPDRLRVVANPPERIALKWGDWLPHKTNLYVSICAGERAVPGATGVVCMEVLDGSGRVIRVAEQENYAANCLQVNDHVLVPDGFPLIKSDLERSGYQTIPLAMSEYQKMDGGLTCLSLRF